MSLAGEADDGHVAASFDLFTKSTINAMNAGLINSSTERLEVRQAGSLCPALRRTRACGMLSVRLSVCDTHLGLGRRAEC